MRILFIVTDQMTVERLMPELLESLTSRGHDVHVACNVAPDFVGTGVTIHATGMHRHPSPFSDVRSLFRLISLIRRLQPDVACYSTPKASLLGGVATRVTRVPIRLDLVRGLAWDPEAPSPSGRILRILERLPLATATDVVAVSPALAKTLRELTHKPIVVLGSGGSRGVDTEFFRPPSIEERRAAQQSLGFDSNSFIIGFIGRICRAKGVGDLLDVAEHSPAVHVKLLGPRETDPDPALDLRLSLAQEAGRVTLLETAGPNGVRTFLWSIDLLVHPSRREGLPNVLLEAQACGTPLIAADIPGNRDAIPPTHRRTHMFAPGDSQDIGRHVGLAASRPDQFNQDATEARDWVTREFHMPVVIARFCDYLEGLVSR